MGHLKELIANYEYEINDIRQKYNHLQQEKVNLENSFYHLLNDNNALIIELERLSQKPPPAKPDDTRQVREAEQKEAQFFASVI